MTELISKPKDTRITFSQLFCEILSLTNILQLLYYAIFNYCRDIVEMISVRVINHYLTVRGFLEYISLIRAIKEI